MITRWEDIAASSLCVCALWPGDYLALVQHREALTPDAHNSLFPPRSPYFWFGNKGIKKRPKK